jgi:hypothetical protein
LIAIASFAGGCKGKPEPERLPVQNEEGPAPMLSVVKTNDAKASAQFLSGFYAIEANAWRWTSGRFSVQLAAPVGSAQNGATLNFAFAIPALVTKHLGKITLSASVNGQALNSSSYGTPGPAVFTADVPKALLTADSIRIDFTLDKDLPPHSVGDGRELGIVANSVGLVSK